MKSYLPNQASDPCFVVGHYFLFTGLSCKNDEKQNIGQVCMRRHKASTTVVKPLMAETICSNINKLVDCRHSRWSPHWQTF